MIKKTEVRLAVSVETRKKLRLLAALLAPFGLPAALLRRRALHDVISGCTVRRGG
jgi:hypothetical protein